VRQVNNFEPLAVTAERVPPAARQRSTAEKPIRPHGGGFYIGESPGSPAVGDARVTFHVAEPGPVSVLAGKAGSTFTEWASPKGRRLEQNLRTAAVTADGFFADLEASNRMMTWLLRLAGFAMMFIGVSMVLAPLRVAADIVPLFGGIVGIGIGLVAVLIALPLSLVTIAIAWVAVRPLLGIPLLLIGVAGIVAVVWWLRRRRAVAAEARAGVEAA